MEPGSQHGHQDHIRLDKSINHTRHAAHEGREERIKSHTILGVSVQEGVRFVVSGALAIAAYIALFEVIRRIPGVPLWLATGGSYVIATSLNYWLNYHWSFASQGPHSSALPKYAVITLVSVTLNALTVPFLIRSGLAPALSAFAFAITWPIFSFFAQKYWAFKEPG